MYAIFLADALFGSTEDIPELTQQSVLDEPNFWDDPAIRIDVQSPDRYRFVGSVGYALVSYPMANSSFDVIGFGRLGFSRTETAFLLSSSRGEELIPPDCLPDRFDYDRTITGVGYGYTFATGQMITSGSVDRTVVTVTGFMGVALFFGR